MHAYLKFKHTPHTQACTQNSGTHAYINSHTCAHKRMHTPMHVSQSTCIPTQTLKNLVLGGIASFTVVDDAKCSAVDLGNNFMVGPNSLGEPRAKVGVC